jgi:ATP-dependent DNA ligase
MQRKKTTTRGQPNRRAPSFIEPMALKLVAKLPEGEDWLYELKFDKYRAAFEERRAC